MTAALFGQKKQSAARQVAHILAFLIALATGLAANAAQPKKILVFTYKLSPSWIEKHGNDYVFAWGVSDTSIAAFHDHAPSVVLSKYFPYSRDPDARHDANFWKQSHPNWIEYECDGRTPATMYGGKNISLDISNPEVAKWQAKTFSSLPTGVHEVALDNYQFNSHSRACGNAVNGKLIARYTGKREDNTFANDIVRWLEQVSSDLHARDIKVNINHTPDLTSNGDPISSPLVQRMVKAVDGILDEGAARSLKSADLNKALKELVEYTTAKGKKYYFLYRLDPFNENKVESAMASYLTMANANTAVYVYRLDPRYGSEPPQFLGFDKAIGEPCGPATQQDGLSTRMYDRGMVAFVLPKHSTRTFSINHGYYDVQGELVSSPLELSGGQGRVLYRQDDSGCKHE